MERSRRRMLAASAALLVPAAAQPPQNAPPPNADAVPLRAMIDGYRLSQMVYVAAKLKIADLLNAGPLTVKDLAQRTGTHEDSLYRLLRTLAGSGVFTETEGPTFQLSPLSALLASDAPGSLRVTAEVAGEPWMWGPWRSLLHSVKTGEIAFDKLYGKHTWDWFAENPGPAQLFNGFMDETTNSETRAV